MATVITEECINCGACEPECPNTAIFQGGVEFELGGKQQSALNEEIFFIVPEKCTECVGFFDYEACAAVCPVDCCVPDPDRPETEEVLIERAKEIHPDKEFGDSPPSRFNPSTPEEAPAARANGADPGAVVASAAAGGAVAMGAPLGRVERASLAPRRRLKAGNPAADFEGELDREFDEIVGLASEKKQSVGSRLVGLVLLVLSPMLGALGHDTKKGIETAYGDPRFFSAQLSTALNIVQNFVLYPILFLAVAAAFGKYTAFTESDRSWITLGFLLALVETIWRLRSGVFGSVPTNRMKFGPSFYGAPLGIVLDPIVRALLKERKSGWVPVEGFYTPEFEEKRERERRYGEVYQVSEFDGGYYVRFELPRSIPPSAAKEELGLGDEMPDYDIAVRLGDEDLTVSGKIVDEQLRAVCGVSPAFPADFRTEIALDGPLSGYRHRYSDKLLEIAVLKNGA